MSSTDLSDGDMERDDRINVIVEQLGEYLEGLSDAAFESAMIKLNKMIGLEQL